MCSYECVNKTSGRKLSWPLAVPWWLCSSYPDRLFLFVANLRNLLHCCGDRAASHSLQLPSSGSHSGHQRPALLAPLASQDILPSPLLRLPPLSLQGKLGCKAWKFIRVPSMHRRILQGLEGCWQDEPRCPASSGNTAPWNASASGSGQQCGGLLGRLRQRGPQPART